MEENKHLRIIANPYLLKKNKNIETDDIIQHHKDIFPWLSKNYPNISQNDIDAIIRLIDEYFNMKIIRELIDDIIEDVIKKI